MKTMLYENEKYWVTRSDSVTVAVRPADASKVKVLTVMENGEITVISRNVPWLNRKLNQLMEGCI